MNLNQTSKYSLRTLTNRTNQKIILWGSLVGGFISSLVKWGSEVNFPPRVAGEISPPAAHIDNWFGWLGINSHSLDYVYQGNTVLGLVSLYHWAFSFAFAFIYVTWSYFCPKIRMWYGAVYGIGVTIFAHGLMIPLLGFRYPVYAHGKAGWLWNLNGYELFSEFLGHIFWSYSIEIGLIAALAVLGRPIKGDWSVK